VGSTQPSAGFLPKDGYRDLWGAFDPPTGTGIGLFLVRPDGTDLHPITPTDGTGYDYGSVSWAPDGDRILTQSADAHDTFLRVRILTADGTQVAQIRPTLGAETLSPVLSPDGKRIAYADMMSSEYWQIRTVSIDGVSDPVETGAEFGGGAAAFRWSPDGTKIVVTHHYYKHTLMFDARGGPGTELSWVDPGSLAWQRLGS